ncbi:MAG: acyltransferase family protein [Prosthecobacter sp.]
MNPARKEARLLELDALRGIAAVIVLWFHYTTQYHVEFGHVHAPVFSVPFGRYGVQLFFVISGFVIFLTLTRAKSFWDFAVNRFSRLYPPYWACVGITFLTLLLMPMPGLNVSLLDAVLNLTMLQYWLQRPAVDGVYWTLAVELVFYAFVSTLRLTGLLRRVELWVGVWLGLIFLTQWLVRGGVNISPLVRTTLLLEHGHFFFAGVLFYRMKYVGFSWQRWLLLAACIAAAGWVRDTAHLLSLLVASLIFLAFITGRLGWIAVAPLLFLGEISYPLYLLHQNIGYSMISRMEQAGFVAQAWLLVPMTLVMLLATLVNFLVEKPARRWLRDAWKTSRLRSLAVPDSSDPKRVT